MNLDINLKMELDKRLFLDQFVTPEVKETFFSIIEKYLGNRSRIETFLNNLDGTIEFYELIGIDYADMISSIMNWPAIIHADKKELFVKYLLLADVVSWRTGELARENILVNHPKDLMTGVDTIYARIAYLSTDNGTLLLRNENLTRRKILKVTHNEFEEMYHIDKERLLERFPLTVESLETVKEWDLNRELVERYEKKYGTRTY